MRLALFEMKVALVYILRQFQLVVCSETQVRYISLLKTEAYCQLAGEAFRPSGLPLGRTKVYKAANVGSGVYIYISATTESIRISYLHFVHERLFVEAARHWAEAQSTSAAHER